MEKELTAPIDLENKIFVIRGKRVMLDRDLSALYGVETKNLNRAVKRNIKRFPPEFMFQLTLEEAECSRCQIVTLNDFDENKGRGANIKYLPYAFTEHGVAMLSSVLKSERAIQINIQIINAFVAMRQFALRSTGGENKNRIAILEKALLSYIKNNDERVSEIIEVLNNMAETEKERKPRKIGFIQ